MAIDIQQPNYSGLVAIAGKNAPLNLQPTGALGLQALQQQQANQASLRSDAMGRMQLAQQGQLGLLSNRTQNRAMDLQQQQQNRQGLLAQANQNLDQQKLAQQGNQFQSELGLKQQQMAMQGLEHKDQQDLKNRILAEQTAKDQMTKLMSEGKQAVHEKGAFASYGLLAMSGAKTPEEAAQIKAEILKEAADKKYMTAEELKAASQMPISQFQNGLKYKVMQFGQVKEYKDMMDAQQPAKSANGLSVIQHADGSTEITSTPTQSTKSEIQKDIKNTEKAMTQIGKLKNDYNPDYFTYKGQADAYISKEAEKSKGTPGLESVSNLAAKVLTGKSPEERADFIEKRSKYMNNIEQVFNTYKKEITGAAAGEREIEMLRKSFLNGDMAPSEFQGAMEQVVSKYKSEADINKNVLNKGIDVSSTQDPVRAKMISDGHSPEEVDAYLAKKRGK